MRKISSPLLAVGFLVSTIVVASAGQLMIAPEGGAGGGEGSVAQTVAGGAHVVGTVADVGSGVGKGVGAAGNLLQGYASMAKDYSDLVDDEEVKSFSSQLSETGAMKGLTALGTAANVVETSAEAYQSYQNGDAVGVMRAIDKGVGSAALGEIPGGNQLNDLRIYLTYDVVVPAIRRRDPV